MSPEPQNIRVKYRDSRLLAGFLAIAVIAVIVAIILGVKVYHDRDEAANFKAQVDQANSENTQTRTDLDKTGAQLAGFQAQLDTAKSRDAGQLSQLDRDKTEQLTLQVQLDGAKSQVAELQSQLDKAKAQAIQFQDQINQSNEESSGLRKKVEQTKDQVADLQSQLDKVQAQSTAAPPPPPQAGTPPEIVAPSQAAAPPQAVAAPQPVAPRRMPIATSFERSSWIHFWGRGSTLHIRNLGPDGLAVNLTIDESGQTRSQSAVIDGGSTFQVKKLHAGDNVVVVSDGYAPVSLTVQ